MHIFVHNFDKIDSYGSYKSESKAINSCPLTSKQRYHNKLLANVLSALVAMGLIKKGDKPINVSRMIYL